MQPQSWRELFRVIAEDYRNHGCDWSKPGFQSLAVHRFGNYRMSIRNPWLRKPLSFIHHRLFRFCRNFYGIELPHPTVIGRGVVIEHQHGIVLHGAAVIGEGTYIRQGVTIGNRYLDKPFDAPKIGRRVNIGAGACILGGVTIGDDASIGANAVVLCDVPVGCLAAGIPAKVVSVAEKQSTSPADENDLSLAYTRTLESQ
ncbi:Serine acetyltransferase [Planctomycetes bacterium CA13]|uniref:Serine acetyltransferase n=1 Tax=Novipirellula herctigrandis TaxID=2527986 RepID=A0A5C5Z3F4_9BACT|nr:Serine acetyltransferase [Planctomycetes bacterium CA13]